MFLVEYFPHESLCGQFHRKKRLVFGCIAETVEKNEKAIQEYVANQLKKDKEVDRLSIFDTSDLLTAWLVGN